MTEFSFFKSFALAVAVAATAVEATAQTWSVIPAPGFINEPITSVTLTIDNAEDLQFSSRALLYYDPSESVDKTGIIYFNGDAYDQEKNNYEASISGNVVTFTPKSHGGVWDAKDKYDLRIPAGAITYMQDGVRTECPLINMTWFYSDAANLSISPAQGVVDDLSTISLSVPEGFSFTNSYFFPQMMLQFGPRVYLADESNQPVGNALAYYNLADGYSVSTIAGTREVKFANPTTATVLRSPWVPVDGTRYVIQVQKSSITVRNDATGSADPCPKTNFLFDFKSNDVNSGIDVIDTESTFTVCSSDGIVILKDASAAELDALPKGLYIVNGRKRILK